MGYTVSRYPLVPSGNSVHIIYVPMSISVTLDCLHSGNKYLKTSAVHRSDDKFSLPCEIAIPIP